MLVGILEAVVSSSLIFSMSKNILFYAMMGIALYM